MDKIERTKDPNTKITPPSTAAKRNTSAKTENAKDKIPKTGVPTLIGY